MADIDPGSQVHVKITKTPTNEAARKTLRRVLNKDPDVKREHRRLEKVRASNLRHKTRGGRPWAIRVPKQYPVEGKAGESGTVLATVDVIRDLESVGPFVELEQKG